MSKQSIFLNGNNFSDLESFYDEVDRVLIKDLDWKTGHNLDAFDDILRGGFGVVEPGEAYKIIWQNASKSKNDLGYTETIRYYSRKLHDSHPSNVEIIRSRLQEVTIGKGQTLFEILVEIIKSHKEIELDIE
jgi:RNAse (barnase) inhibitor barstar